MEAVIEHYERNKSVSFGKEMPCKPPVLLNDPTCCVDKSRNLQTSWYVSKYKAESLDRSVGFWLQLC